MPAVYIKMHLRVLYIIMEANTMNPDQTAPFRSSLIWVHNVCNITYQSTSSYMLADDNYREWRERTLTSANVLITLPPSGVIMSIKSLPFDW